MDKINVSAFGEIAAAEYIYRDFGGVSIAMRRVAPYADIMETIQWAVNQVVDDRPFASAPLQKMISDLAILRVYTNLEIEDFGSSDELYHIYDVLTSAGVISGVFDYVDEDQVSFARSGVSNTIKNIVAYRNSAAGLVAAMVEQSDMQNSELQKMFSTLQDPNQFQDARRFMEVFEKVQNPPQ